MSFRATVVSGLRWTLAGRVTAQVITWAITLVVIRILTPTDYGLLAMSTVFVALLSVFSEIGLGPAIVQRSAIDVPTLRKLFGTVLVVHALLMTLLLLTAPIIAQFYGEARVSTVMRVLSLQLVVAAFGIVPDALLQRDMNFRQRSLIELSAAIAGAVVTLVMALGGKGVWALVTGTLLTQAWRVIGINIISPFPYWPTFSFKGLRSFVTFGGSLTASQLLWLFYSQADMLLAGRWLGKEVLGFYSVAMHLASLPNQRLAGIINNVAFPAFSRVQHDLQFIGSSVLTGVRMLSLAAFAVLWGVSSVAPEIVAVFLGDTWEPAALPLQILGFVMPLRMIANFIPNAVQGLGRSDILLSNAIVTAVIGTLAFFIGVHWGLFGLCVAWLVATPLIFLHNMTRSLSVLNLSLTQLGWAMLPPAIAAAMMYAVVLALRSGMVAYSAGTRLVVLVAAGAVAYVAVSFIVNRRGMRDARALCLEILPTRRVRLDPPE